MFWPLYIEYQNKQSVISLMIKDKPIFKWWFVDILAGGQYGLGMRGLTSNAQIPQNTQSSPQEQAL